MDTVKVKKDNARGYSLINVSDFDEKKHQAYDAEAKEQIKNMSAKAKEVAENADALREYEANRGQVTGAVAADGRNPDGTFSEPTPTDVRFPNKRNTEFANNMGAFLGKSASGLRRELGLPDVPGGISGIILIPEHWKRMSREEQASVAEKLSGRNDLSIKEQKQVISDEVARRAAAGKNVQSGLSTEEEMVALAKAQNAALKSGAIENAEVEQEDEAKAEEEKAKKKHK